MPRKKVSNLRGPRCQQALTKTLAAEIQGVAAVTGGGCRAEVAPVSHWELVYPRGRLRNRSGVVYVAPHKSAHESAMLEEETSKNGDVQTEAYRTAYQEALENTVCVSQVYNENKENQEQTKNNTYTLWTASLAADLGCGVCVCVFFFCDWFRVLSRECHGTKNGGKRQIPVTRRMQTIDMQRVTDGKVSLSKKKDVAPKGPAQL